MVKVERRDQLRWQLQHWTVASWKSRVTRVFLVPSRERSGLRSLTAEVN